MFFKYFILFNLLNKFFIICHYLQQYHDGNSIDYLMRNCKSYTTFNLNYNKFIPLSSLRTLCTNEQYKVLMNVSIVASRDAGILFTENPNTIGPSYEIVLGANFNLFTIVRKSFLGEELARVQSGIPTQLKPVFIQLSITNDDVLEVRNLETSEIIISAEHSVPLDIKYVSFASFLNSRSEFYYDCESDEPEHFIHEIIERKSIDIRRRNSENRNYDDKEEESFTLVGSINKDLERNHNHKSISKLLPEDEESLEEDDDDKRRQRKRSKSDKHRGRSFNIGDSDEDEESFEQNDADKRRQRKRSKTDKHRGRTFNIGDSDEEDFSESNFREKGKRNHKKRSKYLLDESKDEESFEEMRDNRDLKRSKDDFHRRKSHSLDENPNDEYSDKSDERRDNRNKRIKTEHHKILSKSSKEKSAEKEYFERRDDVDIKERKKGENHKILVKAVKEDLFDKIIE